MSTGTLDTIEQDFEALDAILADLVGDITEEEAEAAIDRWFAELGEARDAKLNGYARRIQALETNAAAKKAEADRLAQARKRDESAADWMKRRLLGFVQRRGVPIKGKETRQLETSLFRFAETRNGGKRALTYLVGPKELPEELRTDTITIVVKSAQASFLAELNAFLVTASEDSELDIDVTSRPVEDEVRAALERADEALASWTPGTDPHPDMQVLRYARLEPRGVRLAIR